MRILIEIDDKVKLVVSEDKLLTRPGASSGSLLAFILPTTILVRNIKYANFFDSVFILNVVSCFLLCNSLLMLIRIVFTNVYNLKSDSFALTLNLAISLILWWTVGDFTSSLAGFVSVCMFNWGTYRLLEACPNSFTFGEATVLVQAAIVFLVLVIKNVVFSLNNIPVLEIDKATIILQIGLLGVVFICCGLAVFPLLRKPVQFYCWAVFILVFEVFLPLHVILKSSPVLWIIQLLFADLKTVAVVCYWVLCCVLAVVAVAVQINNNKQASTITRKSFHLLAVAVYLPGMLHTYCLLYTATGVVLAIFIMFEVMRQLHIPPLDIVLQQGFEVFADEKDAGSNALTPLYLLAGVSLPLWLHPATADSDHLPLPLLAGLLAIGLGDTAASAAGTWVGRHRWPGSKKTFEGTLACILIQLIAIGFLSVSGYLGHHCSFTKSMLAVVVTSLIEAKTDQVDNLVLPLLMYCLLL